MQQHQRQNTFPLHNWNKCPEDANPVVGTFPLYTIRNLQLLSANLLHTFLCLLLLDDYNNIGCTQIHAALTDT